MMSKMINGSGKSFNDYLFGSNDKIWFKEQFWIEFIDIAIQTQKVPPRSPRIKWNELFKRWTAEKGTFFPAATQRSLQCYFSSMKCKAMGKGGSDLLKRCPFVTAPIMQKMHQYVYSTEASLSEKPSKESFGKEQSLSRGGGEEEKDYSEHSSVGCLDTTPLPKDNVRFMEKQLYELQIFCDNLVATAYRRACQILASNGTMGVVKRARFSIAEDEEDEKTNYDLHWALREFDDLKGKLIALIKKRIYNVSFNLKGDLRRYTKPYVQGSLQEMATDPIVLTTSCIDEVIGGWPNIVPGFKAGINASYYSMRDFEKAMGVVVASIRANQVNVVLGELIARGEINLNEVFTPNKLYEVSLIMKMDNFRRAVTRNLNAKAQSVGNRKAAGAAYAAIFASAEAKQATHIRDVRVRTSDELVQLERQLKRKREDVDRDIRKVVELYNFVDDYIPMSQRDINKEAIKRNTKACQVHGIPVPNIDDALFRSVRRRYEKDIIQEHREQYATGPDVAEKLKIFVAEELQYLRTTGDVLGAARTEDIMAAAGICVRNVPPTRYPHHAPSSQSR